MRSLTRGEAMHHYSRETLLCDRDWYVWFLGNATDIQFFILLWKYGNGEMVSYTILPVQKKLDPKD